MKLLSTFSNERKHDGRNAWLGKNSVALIKAEAKDIISEKHFPLKVIWDVLVGESGCLILISTLK